MAAAHKQERKQKAKKELNKKSENKCEEKKEASGHANRVCNSFFLCSPYYERQLNFTRTLLSKKTNPTEVRLAFYRTV